MMNCQQTSQLLSQSLDRPLSFREKLSLRLHVMMCGACRNFERQLQFIHQLTVNLATRRHIDDRLKLSERARQRIAQALRSDAR